MCGRMQAHREVAAELRLELILGGRERGKARDQCSRAPRIMHTIPPDGDLIFTGRHASSQVETLSISVGRRQRNTGRCPPWHSEDKPFPRFEHAQSIDCFQGSLPACITGLLTHCHGMNLNPKPPLPDICVLFPRHHLTFEGQLLPKAG